MFISNTSCFLSKPLYAHSSVTRRRLSIASVSYTHLIVPGTMVLTDTCKDPEVLIAWADQFYTEEGGILTWLGIEGKTWQMDEDLSLIHIWMRKK